VRLKNFLLMRPRRRYKATKVRPSALVWPVSPADPKTAVWDRARIEVAKSVKAERFH